MCAVCTPSTDASRPSRQVYHSNLEDPNAEVVCGCAILPMKTTTKGPAPVIQDGDDFIDEVLGFFKANVLFKSFQPAGSADRVLLYLTLYTTQALAKCVTCETAPVALKALTAMAHENFSIPGDSGFTLGTFYSPPGTSQEGDLCRAYFKQAREELGRRLITKVYLDGSPSKLWLAFAKRKFMNKTL
jgi:actin related protein 2/3 complex subunit 3